jgi:transposase
VFHSSEREARKRELVEQKVMRMAAALAKHEGQRFRMPKGYSRYFEAYWGEDGETFLFAREKEGAVERELELCGYFAIVTSEKTTAREALGLYKSRDASEKLFTGSKSFLGGKALRVHFDESAAGRLFVEFVALIIRNRIYTSLKSAVLKNERKANCMTVPAALRELEKIEMIKGGDGIYRIDHAVTATQKEILRAFGLDEEFIKEQAGELSETLRKL